MPNFSGIWSAAQQFQARGQNIWPKPPDAPTIGTATKASATSVSVSFTAPACTGKYPSGISSYTATSTPGCLTASGASSPLVVTGLTTGTAYTFKVKATGTNGVSGCSAASNSVTPVIDCATYTTGGTYSWVAPSCVTSVAVVAIGGGATSVANSSGGGGGLGYKNGYAVTPGSSYTVVVGTDGNNSYFVNTSTLRGGSASGGTGGTYTGTGGGNGGSGSNGYGGGGAGGYSGNGGNGGSSTGGSAGAGGGGGGGSGFSGACGGGGGGGTGLFGQGSNGAGGAGTGSKGGGGGSGGATGTNGGKFPYPCGGYTQGGGAGGAYGGGGGWGDICLGTCSNKGIGSPGAVRIVWCKGGARGTPSFPSTNVGP